MKNQKHRVISAMIYLLILSMVISLDPVFVTAAKANSYDFLAKDLQRPDLISYDQAKRNGHIKRRVDLENEYSFVFENSDGSLTSYT